MQTHHCLSLMFLSATAGLANPALAHPEYRVTIMAPADSYAVDINSAGAVVGRFPFEAAATHAFFNRGAGMVDLGKMRGSSSDAVAINDKGQVLGHWTNAAGQQRGFIYYQGNFRDIGVIPGLRTRYTDINYYGYITAIGSGSDGYAMRSFLRAPNGTFRNIGALPYDNPITFAYALNNCNQITGASGPLTFPDQPLRAFIWTGGVMKDLGDFGTAPNGGLAINNCGQVTGYGSLPTGFRDRHAFLYSGGRLLDLEASPSTEDLSSSGEGINTRGHIVGASASLSGFIYRGRAMESLDGLVDRALGWSIWAPRAINDAGQIAATASRRGVQYAVRLDLIRPLAAAVVAPHNDGQAVLPAADTASAAELRAEAAARAREVGHIVK